jgi:hypothetical protein
MHNVSQLVCKKVVSGGILASSSRKAPCNVGAEFDAKECGAPTHHQYKTTLNMYEKAEPIGCTRCPQVLDVELGTQSHNHCGVASRCCVHLLHSCMIKIIYSTHSTRLFLAALHKNVASFIKYIYVFNLYQNEQTLGVENIFFSMKMSSSTVFA